MRDADEVERLVEVLTSSHVDVEPSRLLASLREGPGGSYWVCLHDPADERSVIARHPCASPAAVLAAVSRLMGDAASRTGPTP